MLPEPLRSQLLNSMLTSMDYAAIQQFTVVNRDILGFSYDAVVSAGTPPDQGYNIYITKLEKINTVFYFVRLFCDEYKAHALVQLLNTEFRRVYEGNSNDPARIRGEFLDCILVENNSRPFIGRSEIKQAVYRMLNKDRPRLTLVRGESKTGRSYLQLYLSEIAGKTKQYELVTINLKEVLNEYAATDEIGMLYGSQVAAYISGYLAFENQQDPEAKELFKITPFTGEIRKYLQKHNKTCLFFFDQFEGIVLAADVIKLILGITRLSLDASIECYTFIAGAPEGELREWPANVQSILSKTDNSITVDHFDPAHVDLFFRKIYLYLSTAYHVKETQEDFLNRIRTECISPDMFARPNVEKIGKSVEEWYDRFRATNA